MFAMTVELNPGQNVLASTPMIKKHEGYNFKIMVYKVFLYMFTTFTVILEAQNVKRK